MSLTEVKSESIFSSYRRNSYTTPSSHLTYTSNKVPPPIGHKGFGIYCTSCGHWRSAYANCGNRCCDYDRMKSINKTLRKKGLLNAGYKDIRFITLTLKPIQELSVEKMNEVRDYFRKLIRRKNWKKYVTGGLYVIEVTKSAAGYHYHFHILYRGSYYPYQELRSTWNDVTKGSYIVWVTRCKDLKHSFDYLLYYVSKVGK